MISKDLATTILGGVAAAATAAQPVINAVDGTMHQGDYVSLLTAIVFAVWGWFTNRGSTSGPK